MVAGGMQRFGWDLPRDVRRDAAPRRPQVLIRQVSSSQFPTTTARVGDTDVDVSFVGAVQLIRLCTQCRDADGSEVCTNRGSEKVEERGYSTINEIKENSRNWFKNNFPTLDDEKPDHNSTSRHR